MSTSANAPAPSVRHNRLPAVIYFEGDMAARNALAGTQRFMRLAADAEALLREAGAVVIVTSEQILAEHWKEFRGNSRVRVIALGSERFRDPRMDGAVYSY